MARKKQGGFSDSVGDNFRQQLLFDIRETEAVPLSKATTDVLFDSKTQWSLHLGTIPSIGFSESMKRLQSGDTNIPVHDVKLHIALPLHTDTEKALSIVKELVPDYDDSKNKMVFVRDDRLVAKKRVTGGGEAAWGKRDKKEQWVNGVSIEITDPIDVAVFMAAAKQAPKNFKIEVNYNEDWFGGTPPKPDERLRRVLDASGIDSAVFQKFSFAKKSSFAHESGLKDYIESQSPTASVHPRA